MADKSGSPMFNPPMNRVTDDDPQIKRVPMDHTGWGFRKGQAPALQSESNGPIKHIPNG